MDIKIENPNTSTSKPSFNNLRRSLHEKQQQQQLQQQSSYPNDRKNDSETYKSESQQFIKNPYESYENYHRQQNLMNENNRIKTEQVTSGESENKMKSPE